MPFSALRIYFENPTGRVLEHPDGYAVIQYHAGSRDMFELQAFLQHTGHLMHQRGWHRLLSDHRVMEPFAPEERDWILGYWLTRQTEGSGPIVGAGVYPPEQVARLPAAQTQQAAQLPGITFRIFSTIEEATNWLGGYA
jgi:hypothetical protein